MSSQSMVAVELMFESPVLWRESMDLNSVSNARNSLEAMRGTAVGQEQPEVYVIVIDPSSINSLPFSSGSEGRVRPGGGYHQCRGQSTSGCGLHQHRLHEGI